MAQAPQVISNSSLQAMHFKLLSIPNKCKNTEMWVFQINAKIQKCRHLELRKM